MGLNSVLINQNSQINSLVLHWPPSLKMVNEQFFDFCQTNKELRIERSAEGDYEIMTPTGWETGRLNLIVAAQLYFWTEQDGSGIASDSSTGFILPNGAVRSPDAAWVRKSRIAYLTAEQKQKFLPLCPDFVIELRSPSDNINVLQDKMLEYIANGASLGWLIDPETKQVQIYQPNKAVVVLDDPSYVSSDDVVRGFKLELAKIWGVGF